MAVILIDTPVFSFIRSNYKSILSISNNLLERRSILCGFDLKEEKKKEKKREKIR